MLEGQVAELLAAYLSRFIENVNAAQLQVSLWSGNVVLHNVQLRSDALERITALLHGDLDDASFATTTAGAPDAQNPKSPGATGSMRMLLAPFTVVRGVVRQLVIDVPWSSLDSEPVRVQVVGVELVLSPLRARPFNAWEEQEREQAIKQEQLNLYERERQRQSREAADETCSQVSSGFNSADPAHRHRSDTSDDATSAASWFSWLWDFDRISQIALRNVCVTLQDVSLRYEFDYEGLHPSCVSAFSVFVQQIRLATTNEKFEETFNKNLGGPMCKRMAVSGTVISIHAIRHETTVPNCVSTTAGPTSATATTSPEGASTAPADGPLSEVQSSGAAAGYEAYAARWAHSTALLRLATLELHVKLVPPGCVSAHPIVEEAAVLSTSSTEATIAAVDGAEVELCFGAVQVLESMWRSYQKSLSSARYRKRLHLLQRHARHHAQHDALSASESIHTVAAVTPSDAGSVRHGPTARQRWRFAVRCVLDDVRQHRQPASSSAAGVGDRSRREVVDAMVHFGPLRRAYCEYWRRSKGVIWSPPLDALEERKLELMERQLTLTQVIFLRCLANAELLVEEDAYLRQQAFIEEARQRTLKARLAGSAATPAGGSGGGRKTASLLFGWFRGGGGGTQSGTEEPQMRSPDAFSVGLSKTHDAFRTSPRVADLPLATRGVCLSDLTEQEWALGQRFIAPHSAPLSQPAVPQNRLSELAAERRLYATLRLLCPMLSVRLDPAYWPLHYDSSTPPVPQATPLCRVRQQLVVHLRTMELFYTTIPDERPDRASLSFFLGSASMHFEGVLRSVLLQSREQPEEDYIVVKRNAQRTHLGVWVAPQLIVCQPLHEWSWWLAEVTAFEQWSTQLKERFYGNADLDGAAPVSALHATAVSGETRQMSAFLAHAGCRSTEGSSVMSTPRRPAVQSLMVNITLQGLDVCVPLFARDVDAADLEVLHHHPSALSSPVMPGSLSGTYAPCGSGVARRGGRARHARSSAKLLSHDTDEGGKAVRPLRSINEGGDTDVAAFPVPLSPPLPLRKDGRQGLAEKQPLPGAEDDTDMANSDYSSQAGSLDSYVSAAPHRYFLNCETCLVISVSETRLCTVAPHTRRHKGSGHEYYLCIGDQSKAVRVSCQVGDGAGQLLGVRHLDLLSFVAGEVLVNPKELIVLFNRGIDAVADPAAFALVNDALLKPAVLASTDADALATQRVVAELRRADAQAEQGFCPWRLVTPTSVEVCASGTNEPAATSVHDVPADCVRHVVMAVLSASRNEGPAADAPPARGTQSASSSSNSQRRRSGVAADALGGRVLTLGMGVARLLIRSEMGTDLAEVVLVAPERMPPSTAPYREVLAALGAQEPRAVELLFRPARATSHGGIASAGASEMIGVPGPLCAVAHEAVVPEVLLSVPDITIATAAGRLLVSMEDVLFLQRHAAAATAVTQSELALTVEKTSVFFDVALVQLMEVMVGVVGALRPLALPPLRERVEASCTTESVSPALPLVSVLVRRTRLQLPMSREDGAGMPYLEVAANVDDLVCTVKSVVGEHAVPVMQVHIEFCVPEATQLVDDTGGDPDVRGLISAMPWAACASEGDAHPLRCTADVALPVGAGAPESPAPLTTCRVAVTGGAVHLYCPFLYRYLASAQTDERVVRLGRLATSPPLHRGYTHVPRAVVANGLVSPPPDAGAVSPLSLDVCISDVDVFLATNAAVPIDVHNLETLTVVHLGQVEGGFQQQLVDGAASSSPPSTTGSSDGAAAVPPPLTQRTHGHVNVAGVRLLDLVGAGAREVPLPEVKLHAERGMLLAPKEDLTGYAYQRGAAGDTGVLLGLHPPPSIASPVSDSGRSGAICLRLSVPQCRSLMSFFAKNAARPALAARRAGLPTDSDAASPPEPGLATVATATFASDSEKAAALPARNAQVGPVSAVTVLATIPAASIVVEAEDKGALNWSSSACTFPQSTEEDESAPSTAGTPARPALSRCLCYEFAMRRAAQFYSASGGRWAASPVQNGQLSGIELLVRSPRPDSTTDTALDCGGEHLLLSVDLVGVAVLEQSGGGDGREGGSFGDRTEHRDGGAAGVKIAAAVRNAHVRVPHLKWWTQFAATVAAVTSAERPLFRPVAGGSSQGMGARPDSAEGDLGSRPKARHSGVSAAARGGSRGGYVEENKASWFSMRAASSALHAQQQQHEGDLHWLSGSLEISNTQLSLAAAPQSGTDAAAREFVPMCRVVVPQVRISVVPLPPTEDTPGASPVHGEVHESVALDQLMIEVPRCPEVLLWQASVPGDTGGDAAAGFVSVLRQLPPPVPPAAPSGTSAKGQGGFWKHATAALAAAPPTSTPTVTEPCCSLRLVRCSAAAARVAPPRYGRCHSVTAVALHRTGVAQLLLRNVALDLPAVPLFALAHALERQWAEAEQLVQVDTRFLTTVPRSSDGDEAPAVHTYTSLEAEISNSGVRVFASPRRAAAEAATSPSPALQTAEWRLAVGVARLTSGAELCAVQTSDREPATLIDDGVGDGWRVQVWHLVPVLTLHDVVLTAATGGGEARWRLPVLRLRLSLPLDRTIVCIRTHSGGGDVDTAEEAELSATADDRDWQQQQQQQGRRSAAGLYQVEPTAASACGELDYHLLASLHVELEPDAADGAAGASVPSVELPLDTMFTLASAAARLAALWRTSLPLRDSALHMRTSRQSPPLSWRRRSSLATWYELKLSLCGHAIDLVAGPALSGTSAVAAPVDAGDALDKAAALRTVRFSTDGPMTLLVETEELEEPLDGLPTTGSSQGEGAEGRETWSGFEDSSSGGGIDLSASATVAVVPIRTLVLLRTGALHLHDGAGTLLLRVAQWTHGGMRDALVADYTPAEGCVRLNVGRVLVCASALTAQATLHWWRTCEVVLRRWSRLMDSLAAPAPPPCETHGDVECDAAPLTVHGDSPRGLLQCLDVDVRHVELLMAPVVRAVAGRAHVSCAQGDGERTPSSAYEVELRCDDVALYPVGSAGATTSSAAVALARVLTPRVVCTNFADGGSGVGGMVLQCRSRHATVVNSDRHGWALIAQRAVHFVNGAVAAFSDRLGAAAPVDTAVSPSAKACLETPAFAPSWLSWVPSVEFEVGTTELLCFAPGCDSTTPAVQITLTRTTVHYSAAAELPEHRQNNLLDVSAEVSAVHQFNADGITTSAVPCPLLTDTRVALNVTAVAAAAAGEERVTADLSVAGLRVGNACDGTGSSAAVHLRIPTGAALQRVAAALWLLGCQRVPQRYAAPLTRCPPSSQGERLPHAGALTSSGGGDTRATHWRLLATSPGIVVQCDMPRDGAPAATDTVLRGGQLCTVDVEDLHAEVRVCTNGAAWCRARQGVELRVGSVRGRTMVMDGRNAAGDRSRCAQPSTVLALHSSPSSTPADSLAVRGALDAPPRTAVSVVQRFDATSTRATGADGNAAEERGCSISRSSSLAVHVHRAELQPSLAFLEALADGVLHPCLAGVDVATAADAAATAALLGSFAHTVLRVTDSDAVLPRPGELERHAGRMQVVEVEADWHLRDDVRLGGEGGLQLHFRATAGRSVLTVRGAKAGSGAKASGVVTLYISHPVAANGEWCPALRVDEDVTVRFENVRVVVVDPPGATAGNGPRFASNADAYVELGERALCLLPRDTEPAASAATPPVKKDMTESEAEAPQTALLAAAAAEQHTVEATAHFSVALSAGARRLAAAGSVEARYRATAEGADARVRPRAEQEGECKLVLHTCEADTGPVTQTPLVSRVELTSVQSGGAGRVRATLDPASTAWRLPVGHLRLLLNATAVMRRLFNRTSAAPVPTTLPWRLTDAGGAARAASRAPHGATVLDVTAEVPLATVTLTTDVGCVLMQATLEEARVQCATDTELSDVALAADATLRVHDCASCDEGAAPRAVRGGPATSRVLLHAKPRLSLAFTRFSADSRSVALSVSVDEVLATVPLTTTVRLLRDAASELGSGCHAFWNSTGVELDVQEDASASASASRWRLAVASQHELVHTGVRLSSTALRFTPVTEDGGNTGSLGAVVDLRHAGSDVVARFALPGYASPFGALNVVLRRARSGHHAALHLTTSVVLANAFVSNRGDLARVVKAGDGESAVVVPPRVSRYVPLQVLQNCFVLGLDGCASAPAARILTWAMLADAMTALADEAAAVARGGAGGSMARARGRAASLAALLYGSGDNAEGRVRAPALCAKVRAVDSQTLSFPVLLTPTRGTMTSSVATTARTDKEGSQTFPAVPLPMPPVATVSRENGAGKTACVVQVTWRRRQSTSPALVPFSDRVAPCEYTVTVEPVWTLWNWTGCRLRLRLCEEGNSGAVVASAEVESGACFQWTPATLAVLRSNVTVAFQLLVPGVAGEVRQDQHQQQQPQEQLASQAAQWWSAATSLSLLEPAPPFVRLQRQGGNLTRGAVRVEQAGISTVVVRCAALLRSAVTRAVYLGEATSHRPLFGAGEFGCVLPEQLVPLFYSEYATTPAPRADRVGFTVSESPILAPSSSSSTASVDAAHATEPFFLTTPVEATVRSGDGQAGCTRFYAVSAMAASDAGVAPPRGAEDTENSEVGGGPAASITSLAAPEPPTTLLLRPLCRIYNADPRRELRVVPYRTDTSAESPDAAAALPAVVCIPPGTEREVTEFGPHAEEPEVRFCYAAHSWSPPVRLLSLATSTQPHVLKHACLSAASEDAKVAAEEEDGSFSMSAPVRRASDPLQPSTAPQQQRCRCLNLQASTSDACLRVRVALQSVPPLKIVNRLKTTLSFTECPLRATPDSPQPASGTPGAVLTTLCSRATRPGSYLVAAESTGYGCWEVPTLDMQGLRLTLHSNVRRGFTAVLDVDLLRAAAAGSTGTRVGNTDAYVYVSLDHAKRQYTVTVVPSRQLETRLLLQPRRLTQMEVYVRSCTLYVAAVTLPTTGRLAHKSLLANGARGRLRLHASHATVPPSATQDEVLAVLRHQELDVVLVRVLGIYATAATTERRVFGSASLGLLEVVDCTNAEAAYPVVLRVGASTSGRAGVAATGSADAASSSTTLGGSGALPPGCGVPQFPDPSWCSVEVQLTRPEAAASAAQKLVVLVPIQQLRVHVPPITVCADDDFLFTLRTTAARLDEEWGLVGGARVQARPAATAIPRRESRLGAPASVVQSSGTVYKVFIYVLRISRVDAVLTYTRTGHRGYNPFDALPMLAQHLIPSIENLDLLLKEVRLANVELPTCRSLPHGIAAFAWPLYRTQLLLQSYKVLGSLDVFGNPRALLGSWSRGVWDLATNASGQSRWSGTQAFLRTTTASTLHSVGVLARSIGNLAGVSPLERPDTGLSLDGDAGAAMGVAVAGSQRRGVVGELLREVGGGVSDAVTKPIRGARERGVNGFVTGFAAGMAGLVGRPVFGFFRGISVTSEFYARLLGGQAELTEPEARRLGLERNYCLVDARGKEVPASSLQPGGAAAPSTASSLARSHSAATAVGGATPILSASAYDRGFDDVPHWRRGDETSVRLAVDRVGVGNAALHAPYPSLCSFLAPGEFRSALPYALTAVLATRLLDALTRASPGAAARSTETPGRRESSVDANTTARDSGPAAGEPVDLARQLQRCAHIKVSLGVAALHTYVTDDVFVRACSLAEVEVVLTAKEQQEKYALRFATALNSAADDMLSP